MRETRPSHPAVRVDHPPERLDELILVLWDAGTTGIEELGPGSLRAFFAAPPPSQLQEVLRAAGARLVLPEVVPDDDWVGQVRHHLRAHRVGPLLIRPPWSRARPRVGEVSIVIDPARAFGTGTHESTRLVLGELYAAPPRGLAILDVGSGTGILSLAALRLGATSAVAVDLDPEAVAATRANARRNGLGHAVDARGCGPGAVGGRFPLVLANLTGAILGAQAVALNERVAARGRLIMAGFLARERPRLEEIYRSLGLEVVGWAEEQEWSALTLKRPTGRRR